MRGESSPEPPSAVGELASAEMLLAGNGAVPPSGALAPCISLLATPILQGFPKPHHGAPRQCSLDIWGEMGDC